MVSAAVFSACCWIPLLAVALGISAGGAASFFEGYRWYFLLAALAFIALGFYLNERTQQACAPDGSCPTPRPGVRRFNRGVLIGSTLAVLLLSAFPSYVDRLASSWTGDGSGAESEASSLTIGVAGMTCAGCEASVESALRAVPGVLSADADFDGQAAKLRVSRQNPPSREVLSSALSTVGYRLAEGTSTMSSPTFAGQWTARLPGSASETQALVVDLGLLDGRWIAECDVDAQDVKDHPIGVAVEDSALHLVLSQGVSFSGTLAPDGQTIVGQFVNGVKRSPLIWSRNGGAQLSTALLEFEKSPPGKLPLSILSPDGAELRTAFNRDRSKVRLVLLLSPT